jgi:CDP-glycerol glycerophosphotransferase
MHSQAWIDMLHNARYVVNNANFPFYYRKRDGQTYVQTWHGTPLKRIGDDMPPTNLSLPYRQLMKREAGYWNVLLAQNDFAAEILPKAFGFDGTTLNLGYPRNDVLVDADAQLKRKQARKNLGLADSHHVVLYAPTWRDNVAVETGYAMVSYLDFDAARHALGEHAMFLLRGHANTAHQKPQPAEAVIDVTRHPDINDLILASDLLITDYSSVMFDYCVTGKPMVFLTPDLDQYRNVTRGFYLDFEDIAPGPICLTMTELQSALADLPRIRNLYADRYQEFTRTFAPRDDGASTVRVVDAIWGMPRRSTHGSQRDQADSV